MTSDEATTGEIRRLVERTYAALSTPGGDVASVFGASEIVVSGSGQDEIFSGPEQVTAVARHVASAGHRWVAEVVTVWDRGEVAWAQILGRVEVHEGEHVPYRTTGVFGRADGTWQWLYWGGAEPQEHPRV